MHISALAIDERYPDIERDEGSGLMNMREKIARAIQKANETDMEIPLVWEAYLPDADAALEAMREPTGGMISKAWNEFDGTKRGFYDAMIDAAREGK